ncbi:MAG TPA: late competence development ComFB family protein [Kamptonema sp.]|nr:late competence development ComFB family protein [Kamptonema sp.]
MGKELFNITLTVVTDEIENILSSYPTYPYQQAFSATGLRQDLLAYVLNRVPNKYAVIEQKQLLSQQTLFPPYPTKELLDIEYYIHLGIHDLMPGYSRTSSALPQLQKFNFSPSSSAS